MSQLYAKKKVGILTLPLTHNYGGILQCVALQKILEDLNYKVIVFNRVAPRPKWKQLLKRLLFHHYFAEIENFKKNYLHNLTPSIQSSEELQEAITLNSLDVVVVGSDQIWREDYALGNFSDCYLTFLEEQPIKKLAYAASFGKAKINPPAASAEITESLKSFEAISVREHSGITILKDVFDVRNAVVTLDPTLMVAVDFYNRIIQSTKKRSLNKKLGVYMLDENTAVAHEIDRIAQKIKLSEERITHRPHNLMHSIFYQKPGMGAWLQLFKEAEFIITDSYHGMLFSIIFRKQFVVLLNEKRGATRFQSIAKQLGLENRIVGSLATIDQEFCTNNNIDYHAVHQTLADLRRQSMAFLTHHLQYD